MKAQLGLKWAFLSILVVLVVVAFVMSPYSEAIDEAISETARIYAVELSGIINLMQQAPHDTRYEHTMPDVDFILNIDKSINFTIITGEGENSYVADFVQRPADVDRVCFYMGVETPDMPCRLSDGVLIFRRTVIGGSDMITIS